MCVLLPRYDISLSLSLSLSPPPLSLSLPPLTHSLSNVSMPNSILQLIFLFPVFLVSGGGVLNLDGIALYTYFTRGNMEISFDDYLPVEFVGALGAIFFNVSLNC